MKLEEVINLEEGQTFDRKSARIDEKEICNSMIGFANADGGSLAIGIENDKSLTGFNNLPNKENEIKESIGRYIIPPIKYEFEYIDFKHNNGVEDKVIIIKVEQSTEVHKNAKDEVYLRCGRENRLLKFDERQKLLYDKGLQRFETKLLDNATLEDIDSELLKKYGEIIGIDGFQKILLARNLAELKNGDIKINYAGILLFGKNPQKWVDLARIRILRYEGTEEGTGQQLNLTKDEKIEGSIIKQIESSKIIVNSILRDFTKLDAKTGKFITVPEYPQFAWTEAIVNAETHREYSLSGSDILVKIFEDRLEVISPGGFPSIVREHNIKDIHFSRNPKIARVLSDFGYVKELGEGVNRIYEEMQSAGLPEPIFKGENEIVSVKLYNNIKSRKLRKEVDLVSKIKHTKFNELSPDEKSVVLYTMENSKITTRECVKVIGKSDDTALSLLKKLMAYNPPFLLDKRSSPQDPKAYYEINPEIMKENQPVDKKDSAEEKLETNQQKLI